jgi:hypothetical protein
MSRSAIVSSLLVALALTLSAPPARSVRITAVEVKGTQFGVVLDDGRVLDSTALIGALLDVALPNEAKQRIRLLDVTPDPEDPDGEIILHRITDADSLGHETELCQPDPQGARWAFPLRGQWNDEGERTSEAGFTLTCSAGAQGKCVRFGYKPWKTRSDGVALAAFHATCIKAVRADYCGDRATTRDGQLIDIYDALDIQRRDRASTASLPFEAGFSPSGAVCVAHTRVPVNVTLDALAASCPRLAGRLGEAACTEGNAVAGHYGPAMIFIRSPDGEPGHQPWQAEAPAREPAELSAGSSHHESRLP